MSSSPLSELPAGIPFAVASGARPCDNAPDESGIARLWDRLHKALQRCVWRCVRHLQAAEDLASDVVALALRRFGLAPAWQDVWSWSMTVVKRLVARFHRTGDRRRVVACATLDSLVSPCGSAGVAAIDDRDFEACLWSRLERREQGVLTLLASGEMTNGEIAKVRRLSVSSVERSRAKLRNAITQLGNDCRPRRLLGSSCLLYS